MPTIAKSTLTLLFLVTSLFSLHAQAGEEEAVKAVINQFFEGMAKKDSALVRSTCSESIRMESIVPKRRDTGLQIHDGDFEQFLGFIGTQDGNEYDERIEFAHIHIDGALASVWTPYNFYMNGTLHHCGANSFQLVRLDSEWKIQYIIDTRRKDCE
jgi:hypothetical protein